MTMTQARPWAVTSRTVVYSAVGAALYAVFGLFSFIIPGTQNVAIRPAFALVPFFGYRFGPVVGFFTGTVGNALIDQIHGYGLLTYWNWSLANGLCGLVAGLLGYYLRMPRSGTTKTVAVAAIGAVSTIVGMVFIITDIPVLGIGFETFLFLNYIPAVLASGLAAVILTPALDRIWEPLQRRAGR